MFHSNFLAQLAQGRSKHKGVKITIVHSNLLALLATWLKQTQKKTKRQTQNKQGMSEVTPPKAPDSNKIGLTRYNKTDPTDSVRKD